MLQKAEQIKLDFGKYSTLYEILIPKDHFLRRLKELVPWDEIYNLLKDKYCLDNGRNAISPVVLFKYLLLKAFNRLSDVDVVERSRYDMSFKFFLDFSPEDDVIHPTSLTRFRRIRLQDATLLQKLMNIIVQVALKYDLVKSKKVIVDSTHIKARYNLIDVNKLLDREEKHLRKTLYENDSPEWKKILPAKPEKETIKEQVARGRKILDLLKPEPGCLVKPVVQEAINLYREMLDDYQDSQTTSKDPDARLGHKSRNTFFYGYRDHLAMTDEGIITAMVVTSGEKPDGEQLPELLEKTREAGVEFDTVIGDTAYSGKENLALAEAEDEPEKRFTLVSKLNPVISNGNRNSKDDGFTYNKDADMYVCPEGHMATGKSVEKKAGSNKNPRIRFYFDISICRNCPRCGTCYDPTKKSRSYSVTIKSDLHRKQEKYQNTDEFRKLMDCRYKIEQKNSELKHRLDLNTALSSGLLSMQMQSAVAIFAANARRILTLLGQKEG